MWWGTRYITPESPSIRRHTAFNVGAVAFENVSSLLFRYRIAEVRTRCYRPFNEMLQIIHALLLLATTFIIKVKCEASQNVATIRSDSNPHIQDQDLTSIILDYDLTEDDKRSWKNLQSSGWGKRSWRDLQGSGWGKRSWKDLSGSGWGKRGWQDLQTSGWGKRGWQNLQSSGWGKRSWKNLQSSGWGKRSVNDLQNSWAKTDQNDNPYNSEEYPHIENLEDSLDEVKRAWNNLRGAWGKRGARDWASMKGAWGKRDPAWHNLKGLWGKRSLDNYSDTTSQDTQDLNNVQSDYSSEE